MNRLARYTLWAVALLGTAVGCGGGTPDEIVLLTHDSFAISDEVLAAFEEETGVPVNILRAGDAGNVVSQAILTKDNPIADVLFGVDNTFLSRTLDEGLFLPYESAGLATVPTDLQLDPQYRVTPIDVANVCLNYDRAALRRTGLAPPVTLRDLTDPAYRGALVVQDPASSSPGLAFLLSTIAEFPEGSPYSWQEYWADLVANDVLITTGWEEAYFDSFSGSDQGGDRPIVVSYASSPPVGVLFGGDDVDEAPTAAVLDGCFRQIEFAGILSGTRAEQTARALIDFMLSPRFQEDIPLNMFVFPASGAASLPDVFVAHTAYPEDPNVISPEMIAANRAAWIEEWTAIVQ